MLENFDAEQDVYYWLEHRMTVVYDSKIDVAELQELLVYAEYVHDDNHLIVDIDFLNYYY